MEVVVTSESLNNDLEIQENDFSEEEDEEIPVANSEVP